LEPEALTRPPGNGFTVYAVDVLKVIGPSDVTAGNSIAILQGGGVFQGVVYEYGGDPVIELATTYLFFLNQSEPPFPHPWGVTFGSPPFGRFPLDAAGRAQAVNSAWAKYGAVAAIAGLTADEASAKVAATLPLLPPRPPSPSSPPVAPPAIQSVTPTITQTATPPAMAATPSPTPSSTPIVVATPTAKLGP